MFIQNSTPNQIATWCGESCPMNPISSIGQPLHDRQEHRDDQKHDADPVHERAHEQQMTIMVSSTSMVGISAPTISSAM